MSVEQADIEKIAKLSRIRIAESDIPEVADRINDILNMVDSMQAVDTSGVEPLRNPLDATPAADEGLFLVPKVIE